MGSEGERRPGKVRSQFDMNMDWQLREIGGLTVRAHSCGPDVERGRCPNLGCFCNFGCSVIVTVEFIVSRSLPWTRLGRRGKTGKSRTSRRSGSERGVVR